MANSNTRETIDVKSLKPSEKKQFIKMIENGDSAHEAYRKILQKSEK